MFSPIAGCKVTIFCTFIIFIDQNQRFLHREHDKNPEIFFSILIRLHDEGEQFLVSVLGENFADNPGTKSACSVCSNVYHVFSHSNVVISSPKWFMCARISTMACRLSD